MLMKQTRIKRSKFEKERILLDIQSLGVVAGCRKHGISAPTYYEWLDKYNSKGLDGLDDQRLSGADKKELAQLRKENRLLKQMLAEKELEARLKDDLLKKKMEQWASVARPSKKPSNKD